MARPQKTGLDYFPLDVIMNDEVNLIEAEHGLIGYAMLIKMYQTIYKKGYYYEWNKKGQLLFSKRVNTDINLVITIINDCMKWDIFDSEMYEKYTILTSKRIQNNYITAVYKRIDVEIVSEYLLIDTCDRKNLEYISIKDSVNANTTIVTDDSNEDTTIVTDDKSTQSKLNKSKYNIYSAFFEEVWKLYPRKRGKGKISETKKKEIYKLGEEFKRCINRYEKDIKKDIKNGFKDKKHQNGSTFFNSGYVDYLDKNFIEEKIPKTPIKEFKPKIVYRKKI